MSYPKTVYVVYSNRGVVLITERVLLRETANYYFFADRYTIGREDKVFKDRAKVCDTFEDAKVLLVKTKLYQVSMAEHQLENAKRDLAKAESLTAPTHRDEPTMSPSGPLTL